MVYSAVLPVFDLKLINSGAIKLLYQDLEESQIELIELKKLIHKLKNQLKN